MISISLLSSGGVTTGYFIQGHSDYADEGSDIVCASVSSAAYMAANTITDIIGAKATAEIFEGCMCISVEETPNEAVRAVLDGFSFHMNELQKQYPEHITVKAIVK